MRQAESTTRRKEHLSLVRALAGEIESAISAIEKNNLEKLSAHVAQQQSLCEGLALLGRMPQADELDAGRSSSDPDEELRSEIRKAHDSLAQLNRVYAGVVKRAARTNEMLSNIYRAHSQGYGRRSAGEAKRNTWSCEV